MKQGSVVVGSSLGAIASGLVAAATTFCCAGPAVFALIGTSGVLAAARLEPYRMYFILASVALLGIGFWLAYRPKGGCIGKNMHDDERQDYSRAPMDRCSDHGGSDRTSKLRERLIMRMLTAAPAITLLLCITACNRLGTERSYAVVGNTSAAVRTAFNADAGKVRVVMVVSPTCGACLEGASEVSQQVAGINQGKTVPLYVLWVPRRGGQEKDVPNATRLIADASAHEFWDGNNLSGVQYRQVLGWRGNAWDVYMVYGPKAQWSGDLPPVPDFFMHQTSEKGPQLDAAVFGTKLKQLL